MIHHIWFIMIAFSVGFACLNGRAGEVLMAALKGTEKAVSVTVQLCAGYLLFCGLMEIARALHAERGIQRALRPIMKRILPGVQKEETHGAIAMNLSMNILGLGNAATPMGLEAMRCLDAERKLNPVVKHDMNMLLILNATSLQLLPTTVLTLRVAAGSADANAVLLPTILCTAFSTLVGVSLGLICRKWEERRLGQ